VSSGGFLRWRLAKSLKSAYAVGLVTQDTFAHRIDHLYGRHLVHPQDLVGDLTFRRPRTGRSSRARLESLFRPRGWGACRDAQQLPILALDWTGALQHHLIGRSACCDLLLEDRAVSRRHAELFFREGRWILIDLDSTNGTYINDEQVQRAELLPGDVVTLGAKRLRVD
jgi:hypothetical protein